MRQIAYVGEDGETSVYDLDLDSGIPVSQKVEPQATPGDHLTNWPTWSPAGDRLAYFRYEIVGGELTASGVCVAAPDGSGGISLYRAEGEAPIYMCWSPDGQRIAALVQAQEELYLRVVDARGDRPPTTVAQGAPLYFAWLPDSRGLVVHVGLGRRSMPETRISWVRIEGGQVTQAPLARSPARAFRAPSWSNKLAAATLALEGPEGSDIAVQRQADADVETLFSTGLSPAFQWSPSGELLACSSRTPDGGTLYSGISLYNAEDRSVRTLLDGPVLAFLWSPDSQRLVYAAGDVADRVVGIHVVDVGSGEVSAAGWVRPSRDLFMMFSYFDQYSQSVSLVSPDGAELVLAASRAKERENGSVPTVRQILVRSLSGGAEERPIARGRLAFWRPA